MKRALKDSRLFYYWNPLDVISETGLNLTHQETSPAPHQATEPTDHMHGRRKVGTNIPGHRAPQQSVIVCSYHVATYIPHSFPQICGSTCTIPADGRF